MNLGNDKWQNTQGKLGSSSTGRGEAPETRGRELESLLATTEYASPTDTVVVRSVLGSPLSRTAVYGPVRTVVWQGSAGDRRPYADSRHERSECKPDAKRKRDSAQPQERAQPSRDVARQNHTSMQTDVCKEISVFLTTADVAGKLTIKMANLQSRALARGAAVYDRTFLLTRKISVGTVCSHFTSCKRRRGVNRDVNRCVRATARGVSFRSVAV